MIPMGFVMNTLSELTSLRVMKTLEGSSISMRMW